MLSFAELEGEVGNASSVVTQGCVDNGGDGRGIKERQIGRRPISDEGVVEKEMKAANGGRSVKGRVRSDPHRRG